MGGFNLSLETVLLWSDPWVHFPKKTPDDASLLLFDHSLSSKITDYFRMPSSALNQIYMRD